MRSKSECRRGTRAVDSRRGCRGGGSGRQWGEGGGGVSCNCLRGAWSMTRRHCINARRSPRRAPRAPAPRPPTRLANSCTSLQDAILDQSLGGYVLAIGFRTLFSPRAFNFFLLFIWKLKVLLIFKMNTDGNLSLFIL